MPIFTTDLLEYGVLVHRILRDDYSYPPEIDAMCFFGQTKENDLTVLYAVAEQWKKRDRPIVLVGACEEINKGGLVVRGSDVWVKDLEGFGINRECIQVYPMSEKFPPSTDAEAWGMVEIIKKHSWKRVTVTVTPLHTVRAFVSLVSACQKSGLQDVCIWSTPCGALPWDVDVFHSGTMPSATREEHISGELEKIFSYCAEGDYLTARQILVYLRRRTKINEKLPQ